MKQASWLKKQYLLARRRRVVFAILAIVLIPLMIYLVAPGVPTAIVAAAVSISAAFITQVYISDIQHRRSIETAIREKNSAAYQAFLKFWMDLLLSSASKTSTNARLDRSQLMPKMNEISQPLMMWASNDFVSAYRDFRLLMQESESTGTVVPPAKTLFAFEDLIVVMRQDMGHDTREVKRGDFLAFFINDLKKIDARIGVEWKMGQTPNVPENNRS